MLTREYKSMSLVLVYYIITKLLKFILCVFDFNYISWHFLCHLCYNIIHTIEFVRQIVEFSFTKFF